jgi:hypothetical protein
VVVIVIVVVLVLVLVVMIVVVGALTGPVGPLSTAGLAVVAAAH